MRPVATVTAAPESSARRMAFRVRPETPRSLLPMVAVVPAQLFAYHTADLLGNDIDQPRNLAKSVVVE